MSANQAAPNLLKIAAMMSSIIMVGLATGFTIPLVTLRLTAINADMSVIGSIASAPAFGMLLVAPFVGMMSRRIAPKLLLIFAVLLSISSIAICLSIKPSFIPWFILRFLMGSAGGILVVLGEAYLNHIAENRIRGRIIAAYTSAFTLCQVAGPALLAWLGPFGLAPLLTVILFHLIGLALLLPHRFDFSVANESQSLTNLRFISFIQATPVIAVGVFLFGFFDSTALSLLPIYGLEQHLSEQIALLMVTAVFAGDACLQIPLGYLADRFDRTIIHLYCGLMMLALIICIPFLLNTFSLLWPALIILGGAAGGTYTLSLIRVGEHYSGQQLIMANSFIAILFGIGSLLGPLIASAAMAWLGANGLMITLAIITLCFLVTIPFNFALKTNPDVIS